jgi:hypothetical protein
MIERERRETKKKEEDELAQIKLQEYRYKILSNPMFKGASELEIIENADHLFNDYTFSHTF